VTTRNRYATQGRLVIAALKQKPHTYRQMLNLGVGNSPWKRVAECLNPERETLLKVPGADGLVRWRVVPKRDSGI
jgi:hypothetical protein